MKLSEFWLQLDNLTNKPEGHPDIEVRILTLMDEFGVGVIEIEDGILYIQTDEHVEGEYI